MSSYIRAFILITIIVVGTFGLGFSADDINENAGTSTFAFLKINPGARAVGMGGAFTGLADDISSLYYNPAGIGLIEYDRYMFGYHDYFVGMQSGFFGYVHPLDYTNVFGLYISYLNYGDLIEANANGDSLGTFGGGDMLIGLTYARNINDRIQVGGTGKFIYEKIQNYIATGIAFDFGVRMTTDRGRIAGGLMLQNIGKQLSSLGADDSYSLPLTIRFGLSAKPRQMKIVLAGDLIKPRDNDLQLALGAEYYNFDPFLIRVGWNSNGSEHKTSINDQSWTGVSLGFGIKIKNIGPLGKAQLSYSYTPASNLGTSHRITLTGGK